MVALLWSFPLQPVSIYASIERGPEQPSAVDKAWFMKFTTLIPTTWNDGNALSPGRLDRLLNSLWRPFRGITKEGYVTGHWIDEDGMEFTARPSRNREDRWLATVFSAAERRRIVARGESSNPWFSGRFLGRPEGSAHRYPYPSSRGSRTHPWLQSVAAPRLQSTDCCCYFLCVARKYRMLVERIKNSVYSYPCLIRVPSVAKTSSRHPCLIANRN